MRDNSISMLLVGENVNRCPELHWWADNRELWCEYTEFYHEACNRISRRQFDLVISEYQLPDRTAFPLLDVLAGSPATLFFSEPLRPISCGCSCSTAGDGASAPPL
jgi:hypothetical protein